jgi:hypothetical protein
VRVLLGLDGSMLCFCFWWKQLETCMGVVIAGSYLRRAGSCSLPCVLPCYGVWKTWVLRQQYTSTRRACMTIIPYQLLLLLYMRLIVFK